MRRIVRIATALAAFTSMGLLPAEAVPLTSSGGMSAAINEVGLIESVHCTPGWRHHHPTHWRRANGCPRYARGGVVVVPGVVYGPRFRAFAGPRFHRWGHRGHRRWR
jgi:hypothetical protein